jgi:hypothetical protein
MTFRPPDEVWPEGRKDDQGKAPFHLIAPEFLFALAAILAMGAAKYAERNWERGMSWSRVFSACMRHLWAWWAGRGPTNTSFLFGSLDEESGYSHLWHAAACIMFLVTYEARQVGEDDRPQG